MIRFFAVRLAWLVATVWGVYTVAFVLMELAPGSPLDAERALPEHTRRQLEERYLLHLTPVARYQARLSGFLQGDLGPSFRLHDYTVGQVIAEGLPHSAVLGACALLVALAGGLLAGSWAAARRGGWLDTLLMASVTLGLALPNFVLAGAAILLFSFTWNLLPPAGWGGLRELVLPALCLGAPFAAAIARLTRSGIIDALSEDYARTARAKGLSQQQVVSRHALRIALLPVVSYLAPTTAGVLTGSLVIERIFAIPGMGSHFVQAALSRDYPLALGIVVLYTLLVATLNLLADVALRWIDPRVRLW